MEAVASIYIDSRPRSDKQCAVKVKVTSNRKRRYYATGIALDPKEFDAVMNAKRRTKEQREVYDKLMYLLNKATGIIKRIGIFSFDRFEEGFFENRNITTDISYAFDKHIKQLRIESRIGTAVSYECAKNSIESYKKGLQFTDITKQFLTGYEADMLKKGKSLTTVGIYLRSLRTIYNQQSLDKGFYPFGEGKDQYSIPAGQNIKKALALAEIAKIYHYEAADGYETMAKDYWLFLYLCNGMNVKDFCLLKWENIDGDMLRYKRSKTSRTKRDQKPIDVSIKSEAWAIIKKYGQPSINKDVYIFPHLTHGMDAERQREVYQQLTKVINKHMKRIAKAVGIKKEVTTYYARHSFATVLKRSGTQTEMISELLGHSSVLVTKNYLDSFEKEQIEKVTDALTSGFKTA